MAGVENMTRQELIDHIYDLEDRLRDAINHQTEIPSALLDRTDLLAEEAQWVTDSNLNWRGRLRSLGSYGMSGGSAGDRRIIVMFMAGLETRRSETRSLR